MKIDRRITNGLIWAGAAIVLGVPAVDLLSAQFGGDAPAQVAAVAPQVEEPAAQPAPMPVEAPKPASAPAAQPVAQADGAVESYLQSGRELPSYISGAPAASPAPEPVAATPAPAPAPIQPAPSQPAPTEMAALPPAKVAPVPMPLSMRPRPVQTPLVVEAPPLIVEPSAAVPPPMGEVTAADLADWETGPLSEFLAQRARERGGAASDYDPDGFYLDQGPNNRPRQRAWVVGPADDVYFAD